MIKKYYEEELRYLYESGKKFSTAHPEIAAYLDIDAIGDRDPHIERLFEGFAFLTARIREKIDDSFPELTEGLIDLICPRFQLEIPSLCIVEFKPRKGHLQNTRILPKKSVIMTKPLGPFSKPCSFFTTQDVNLNPIIIRSIEKGVDHLGRGSLRFNFEVESAVKFEDFDLNPLKLYIHAEMPTAMAVHKLMTNHITAVEFLTDDKRQSLPINPSQAVSSGGFSCDELLLPCNNNSLIGNALLLDYFTFPEKFMFINLFGLDKLPFRTCVPQYFSIIYHFDCVLPNDKVITSSTFRLSCTPAINLFKKSVEPVLNSGTKNEYLIQTDSQNPASVTHSIISVAGTNTKTGERFIYEPISKNMNKENFRTYSIRYRNGFSGKRELYISTNNNRVSTEGLQEETLSIDAWCTNGNLPRDEMTEGTLNVPGINIPDFISFTNITRPTNPVYPPSNKNYLWIFLSHLNAGYQSLSSPEILKSFLNLYNWSGSRGCTERIAAITDISLNPHQMIYEGDLYRGVTLTIFIKEQVFCDTDDLHLFGKLLMTFLSCYTSINSILELIIITKPSEKRLQFNSMRGKKCPI